MKKVHVSLGKRSYRIVFGAIQSGFAAQLKMLGLQKKKALLVTSKGVAAKGHARILSSILSKAGCKVYIQIIPNGEAHKTLRCVEGLHRYAANQGFDRTSLVVALGGGVVTDLAGFVAATYMRGIAFVSVPTTLLGMVDAAIGGKTGVDIPEGKNLVGAFWQPKLVYIDTQYLKTLPMREWKTGMAEVIKYGVIKSRSFFTWLEKKIAQNHRVFSWTKKDIDHAVYQSVKMKAAVVSADETEKPLGGGREILNFGHTSGHALEAATGYRQLTHGEAISVGMLVAGQLAVQRKMWSAKQNLRLESLLKEAGLPVRFPILSSNAKKLFWKALQKDKKIVGGNLRFVLPQSIGHVAVYSEIGKAEVRKAIERFGY